MNNFLFKLAKRLRPDLETLSGQQRMSSTADVLTLLYALPLMVVGLVWLITVSSWISVRENWALYILMAGLLYLFNRLGFFVITEIREGGFANSEGALDGMALWAALLILGPTALWLDVGWNLITWVKYIISERTTQAYWNRSRIFVTTLAGDMLATLAALEFYRGIGGKIPIDGLTIHSIAPALLAIFVQFLVELIVFSGYIGYVLWALKNELHTQIQPALRFFFMAFALPALANPFSILAAGMYTQGGLWEFLYTISGLLLVAVLARRLSQAAEYSRQQSRQLEQLEKLGRSILDAPPDASTLPEVLKEHVLTMFSLQGVFIWTEERGGILREPTTLAVDTDIIWKWLHDQHEPQFFLSGEKLPWEIKPSNRRPVIVSPIMDMESGQPMGGIYLELHSMAIPWDRNSVLRQLPAVQSIGAQVASAIHQAHVYSETLAMQKTLQELSLARTIQASFLPETIPQLPGWQLTAILEPARQMAGDFYDFIPLPNNKLGFLIADVADKGLGSALYMALSCTLIRTFADELDCEPATVLTTANQHILRNARANLFVTVFYGVLDPVTGLLSYANAGHSPPYLLGADRGIQILHNTGMPLGIDEENTWNQEEVQMQPGDMLLLYTDGVTDAQNNEGEFIDRKMILGVAQQNLGKPVQIVQQVILDKVHGFVGDAPRFDDLTLVILGRENGKI